MCFCVKVVAAIAGVHLKRCLVPDDINLHSTHRLSKIQVNHPHKSLFFIFMYIMVLAYDAIY